MKGFQALISFLNIAIRSFGASPSSERLKSSCTVGVSMTSGRRSVAMKKYELCEANGRFRVAQAEWQDSSGVER